MSRRKPRWKHGLSDQGCSVSQTPQQKIGLTTVERLEHIAETLDRIEVLLSGEPLAQQQPTGTVNEAD